MNKHQNKRLSQHGIPHLVGVTLLALQLQGCNTVPTRDPAFAASYPAPLEIPQQRQAATGIAYAADMVLTADHVVERDDNLTVVTPEGVLRFVHIGRHRLLVQDERGWECVSRQTGHARVVIFRPGAEEVLELAPDASSGAYQSIQVPAEPHEFKAELRLVSGGDKESLAFAMSEPHAH